MEVTLEQARKDWSEPRSARAFTGFNRGTPQQPNGTILHCFTSSKIPCTEETFAKFGKAHVLVNVLGIRQLGWSYAPWKKQTKLGGAKTADVPTKKLFEEDEYVDDRGSRIIKSCRMYSYPKEGQQAMGPRDDATFSVLSVGQTYHFKLQPFMYESKKSGDNVFPEDVDFIPEGSLVEIMIKPGHLGSAKDGFGMAVTRIRPCGFSLHSYLHPLGLSLLPSTYEDAVRFAKDSAGACEPVRNMLEQTNVSFYGQANPGAFLADHEEGFFKLCGLGDGPAMASAHFVDIRESDLLFYTNAGKDLHYARLLVDLAAAMGALNVYVTYNEWNSRQNPNLSAFRGIPLIDTEKFLSILGNPSEEDLVDASTMAPFPYSLEDKLSNPYITRSMRVTSESGAEDEPTCLDFVLCSDEVNYERGYLLHVGDDEVLS